MPVLVKTIPVIREPLTVKQALVIMAKAPRPGRTKTRLCPPLSHEQAADLYRCFLMDTITIAREAVAAEAAPTSIILIYPEGDRELLANLIPATVELMEQRQGDLGTGLQGAFEDYLDGGHRRVVIIGTDSPSMPASLISEAFYVLKDHDLVLGPARDGGYYLIGLNQSYPRLFDRIAWSDDRVLAQTLARAAQLELDVQLLPPWYDIDTVAELRELIGELATGSPAAQTANFFQLHAEMKSALV
ncbi:MAG TPA: TIGR04282 family arsenosugar biosynthesis glycosyltransferase [Gemmataceae bacterium]|nr:TIGR04282 family arsenosugar biosynthesis glycosyltransferase [Gemmataceae bacterium]